MRRYLQTLGRTWYARAKAQKPIATPVPEPPVVPSPTPPPPPPLRWEAKPPLCESLSDLVKRHSVRVMLKKLRLQATAAARGRRNPSVLDLNIVFSPTLEKTGSEAVAAKIPYTKPEEEAPSGGQKSPFQVSTFDQLFTTSHREPYRPNNKITVVGASDVGMATVFSLLAKGVTNDISMIDCCEDKLKGELMDFQSGSKFLQHAKLRAGKDYDITSDSKICILTPCSETLSGDKTYDCAKCNAEVLKNVVPKLLRYSPDCIFLVALEPVDVLSYLAWRVSDLPRGRVLGYGTNLATATFRYLLSDRLGLAPSACNGYIIGENGESCVPVWSGVTAGGVLLKDLNPEIGTDLDPENWQEIHRQVVQSAREVKDLKGGNSWAAALSITDICTAILNDSNCVRPLSTHVKGEHSIEEDVFMSLPCVVGASGVADVIRQPLSAQELELLRRSAEVVAMNMGTMKITQ